MALKREVGRLRQKVALRSARIVGEGAFAPAEHLIARPKLLHVSADRLDLPGDVESRNLAPRPAQADPQTHDVWHPLQEMPVADIDCRCAHAHEHLIVLDDDVLLSHRRTAERMEQRSSSPCLFADPIFRALARHSAGRAMERRATARNMYGFSDRDRQLASFWATLSASAWLRARPRLVRYARKVRGATVPAALKSVCRRL